MDEAKAAATALNTGTSSNAPLPYAQQVQARLDQEVAQIRDDRRLTRDEIRAQIQGAWEAAQKSYSEALAGHTRQLEEDVVEREKEVFAVSPAVRSSVRQAYADAYDRTSFFYEAGDPDAAREELERLLIRAERTGDTEMQTAIYHILVERGEQDLRDRFLAYRPAEKKRWDAYVASRQNLAEFSDPINMLGQTLADGGLKQPEELY